MHFTSMVFAALAATAVSERLPYKMIKKSASLVQLAARQEPGYIPEQTYCGMGDTCSEACGAGFEQCASSDGVAHCFDQGSGESCCQDALGHACEAGFYCAGDIKGDTWCCPEGMTAEECAADHDVEGGLSSQVPLPAEATSAVASSNPIVTPVAGSNSSAPIGTVSAVPTPTSGSGAGPESGSGSDSPSGELSEISGATSFAASGAFAAIFAAFAALL